MFTLQTWDVISLLVSQRLNILKQQHVPYTLWFVYRLNKHDITCELESPLGCPSSGENTIQSHVTNSWCPFLRIFLPLPLKQPESATAFVKTTIYMKRNRS